VPFVVVVDRSFLSTLCCFLFFDLDLDLRFRFFFLLSS
jgi:hypothetical protein